MTTKPFTKVNPADIPKMIKLKNSGWSFQRIADKYKVHNSTLVFHFKKSGKKYLKNKCGAKPVARKKAYYKKLVAEPVSMYKDYLDIEEKRLKKISSK